jgi:glycosyltransferase involved in cell wall biosynthesis
MVSQGEATPPALMGQGRRGVLLMAGWYYPESVGGTESYVHWLARDLQRRGYYVKVAAPAVEAVEREYEHDGVPVYRYPVGSVPEISEVRGVAPPQHFDVFARWLEREQPGIVHLHSLTRGCGFYHARRVKELHLPLVITVHVPGFICPRGTMMRWGALACDGQMRTYRCATCSLHAHGVPRTVGWPLSLVSRWAGVWAMDVSGPVASALTVGRRIAGRHAGVRELFRLADRVVVVSQWLYQALRLNQVDPEKLVLVRHGLPEEYLRGSGVASTRVAGQRLRVGYIGRMHPVKGLGVLVSAMRVLPPSLPIELHIYGTARGDEERQYLSTVRLLAGNDHRIVFQGELVASNREDTFRSLDVLAVPSLWLETGPLVVLEAFAAGLPVLGSNAGGMAELVTNGVSGRLVEVGNVDAWASALSELSAQATAGHWAWSVPPVRSSLDVAEEMLEIYHQTWDVGRNRPG